MIKDVSVILPTLNERGNIILLVNTINRVFDPLEIIIVDDGSTDGTIEIVKNNLYKISNLKLILNSPALSLAKSIQKGINIACGKYIAWMDADLSHPPQLLNTMIEKLKNADIVIGSWFIEGGSDRRNQVSVVFRSILINKICQLVFGRDVTAYTSGFTMSKKSVFSDFQLSGDYGEYFIDFVVKNQRYGKKIIEVPFICKSRIYGHTKTSPNLPIFIKRGVKYLLMIISLL